MQLSGNNHSCGFLWFLQTDSLRYFRRYAEAGADLLDRSVRAEMREQVTHLMILSGRETVSQRLPRTGTREAPGCIGTRRPRTVLC